jgi:hypothetical protein
MGEVMPNDWDDDEIEDSNLVKSLRKQIRDLSAKRDSLQEENNTLRPQVRKISMESVLSEIGVNTKIAGLMPEGVQPTKEAVEGWLKDYGELFNIAPKDQKPPATQPAVEPEVQQPQAQPQGMDTHPSTLEAMWAKVQSGEAATGVSTPDIEKQQQAQLAQALANSNGSFDQYIANLRGGGTSPM